MIWDAIWTKWTTGKREIRKKEKRRLDKKVQMNALYEQIYTHIRTYVPPGGQRLFFFLGGKGVCGDG